MHISNSHIGNPYCPENWEEFQGVAWYSQSKYGMSAIGSMEEFTLLKALILGHTTIEDIATLIPIILIPRG